jgi:rhodanese-related sulfurtransferase
MYLTGTLQGLICFMHHSAGFLRLVADAKTRVREISVDQTRARLRQNPKIVLLDVREDSEWAAEHAADAIHLGKGVLERDLEKMFSDVNTEIIMYCGGGYRSVLTCGAENGLSKRPLADRRLQGDETGRLADEDRRLNHQLRSR